MEEKIKNFIIEELHAGNADLQLDKDDDLLVGGLLGSLQMMRLIDFIEGETQEKIPPQDLTIDNFMSIGAMVSYLSSRNVG